MLLGWGLRAILASEVGLDTPGCTKIPHFHVHRTHQTIVIWGPSRVGFLGTNEVINYVIGSVPPFSLFSGVSSPLRKGPCRAGQTTASAWPAASPLCQVSYMSVCVCVHVCVYVCAQVCMVTCIYASVRVCICPHICVHTYVFRCAFVYVFTCVKSAVYRLGCTPGSPCLQSPKCSLGCIILDFMRTKLSSSEENWFQFNLI